MHTVDTLDDELFIGLVDINGENHDAEYYETLKAKNTNIHFQLYTGAMCNVLSSVDLKKINKNLKVVRLFSTLESLSGCYIRCGGSGILPCVWKKAMFQ